MESQTKPIFMDFATKSAGRSGRWLTTMDVTWEFEESKEVLVPLTTRN